MFKDQTFDLAFSYWIFIWFLFYYFKLIPYNPKIFLILALIHNIILCLLYIYFGHSVILIVLFLVIIVFIKIIPLWILRNTAYKTSDFIAGSLLFILFNVWKYIRLGSIKNIIDYDKKEWNQLKSRRPVTPLLSFLYKNGFIKY
jgi:hypothetical protein